MLLVLLLVLMYGPYIVRGGLLRDDLGFVTAPRYFPTYVDFQSHISSLVTMTARPVSAVLHGASYWFLGANAAAHHVVNSSLFTASVLLVYWALCRIAAPSLAFLTCAFAAVYPAASGTIFSAMMMNSNLAAAFWAGALALASSREPSVARNIAIALLLLLSGLSYESFIPLYVATILASMARGGSRERRDILRHAAPAIAAVAILGLYRTLLERLIFASSFTRMSVPEDLLHRIGSTVLDGARVAVIDSIRVSSRALRTIALVAPEHLLLVALGTAAVGIVIYRSMSCRRTSRMVAPWVAAVFLFLVAHVIFVFSEYLPSASGFESRTQGGIRFAGAFLIAATGLLASAKESRFWRLTIRTGIIGLFTLFSLGMAGQREGWIEAAKYNESVVERIGEAMQGANVGNRDSLIIVAELDRRFVGSANAEPVFGTSWDLGPALGLAHPNMKIGANVYEAKRARVDSLGVSLDGYWRASFPFYYFREGSGALQEVASRTEWLSILSR